MKQNNKIPLQTFCLCKKSRVKKSGTAQTVSTVPRTAPLHKSVNYYSYGESDLAIRNHYGGVLPHGKHEAHNLKTPKENAHVIYYSRQIVAF